MGKSLKNAVSPDEMYEAYGADTLRLYEMFMGPLDASRPWNTADIVGVHRFLQRLWRNVVDEDTGALRASDAPLDDDTRRLLHRTIKAVTDDKATTFSRGDNVILRYNHALVLIRVARGSFGLLLAWGVVRSLRDRRIVAGTGALFGTVELGYTLPY